MSDVRDDVPERAGASSSIASEGGVGMHSPRSGFAPMCRIDVTTFASVSRMVRTPA